MKINTSEDIGALVRETRKQLEVTQKDLSLTSGVGLRFINELEKGKSTCQIGKVLKVLQTLKIDCDFIPSFPLIPQGMNYLEFMKKYRLKPLEDSLTIPSFIPHAVYEREPAKSDFSAQTYQNEEATIYMTVSIIQKQFGVFWYSKGELQKYFLGNTERSYRELK